MITIQREDILNAFTSFIKTAIVGLEPQEKQELYQCLIDQLKKSQESSE